MSNQDAQHTPSASAAPQHAELGDSYAAALGANVERLRREGKLTKTRFAIMAGIGRPLLNAIESGTANPRLALICKMAEILEVTPQELLELPEQEPIVPMRLTPRGHLIPDDGYHAPQQ